jgi:protein-S-isoprenylcysteine O-methyltransferase Ste14
MDAPTKTEGPRVRLHPPTLMFVALLAGYGIRLFAGGRLPLPHAFAEGLGGLLILIAIAVILSAVSLFAEAGEALRPETPTAHLFTKGPYRFSRNPIYLAMMLFGAGFGIATSNVWIIVTTAFAGVVIHFMVILREEEYLEARFGEEYAAYRRQVRRWI